MKRSCLLFATLTLVLVGLSSFTRIAAPKVSFFKPLEQYYASLNNQPIDESRQLAVGNIGKVVIQAKKSDSKVAVVFTCTDNAFRSQATQIILQSIANVNQYKKSACYLPVKRLQRWTKG